MNVANGARIFLLYISAQISYPPSMHKFLYGTRHREVKSWDKEAIEKKKNSPQRSGSFDDDLFLGVRESADQRPDDVFAL